MKKLTLAMVLVAGLFAGSLLQRPIYATYTPTPVKSVQQVSINFPGAGTSATATLSPTVIASASLLVYQSTTAGDTGGGTLNSSGLVGTITSGTTVTVSRVGTNILGGLTYNATVVEYLPQFIKSQGCGSTAAIADDGVATSATATISSTTPTKTIVSYTGATNTNASTWASGAGMPAFIFARLTQTNATTLTASRANATATAYGLTPGYCYIEFK